MSLSNSRHSRHSDGNAVPNFMNVDTLENAQAQDISKSSSFQQNAPNPSETTLADNANLITPNPSEADSLGLVGNDGHPDMKIPRISIKGFGSLPRCAEICSKLKATLSHLLDIVHDCGENCYGVQDLFTCIRNMAAINNYFSVKTMANENEDDGLFKKLSEYAGRDESSVEVATYLSSYYRSRSRLNSGIHTPNPIFNQQQQQEQKPKLPGQFIQTQSEDVIAVLSIGKKPELAQLLERLDSWDCDIFKIEELISKPLTTVVYSVMQKRNIFERFGIPCRSMINYMLKIETRYDTNAPYHNQVHAADVVQTMHYLLSGNLLANALSDLEIFALIFASAIHDVDHPGFTNQYLIRLKSPLAILYNDKHVLENHHLAVAFKILFAERDNFLTCLSECEAEAFRRMVIDFVLCTDMTMHVKISSAFQVCADHNFTNEVFVLDNENNRMDVMRGLIHFCDINTPSRPLEIYQKWTKRISEEFFVQGDLEREAGLAVSPMCDRYKTDIGKGQIAFIEYIVLPFSTVVIQMLNCGNEQRGDVLEGHLQSNLKYYKEKFAV